MSINKNWFRIFNAEECEKRFKDYMLLIRDWPAAYYIAHTGGNGLPVIDKKIENVPYFMDVEEFTLTEMEFYFLAELNTMLYFSMERLKTAKKQSIKLSVLLLPMQVNMAIMLILLLRLQWMTDL